MSRLTESIPKPTSCSATENIREYLALTFDPRIREDDSLFIEAQRNIVDDPESAVDPNRLLFDVVHYNMQRTVRMGEVTALRDYFEVGGSLGLSPHPIVDIGYIVKKMSNGDGSGRFEGNALVSILKNEVAPNIFFDAEVYIFSVNKARDFGVMVPSVKQINPVVHYLSYWKILHKSGFLKVSKYFDCYFYDICADRRGIVSMDPLSHYLSRQPADRDDCNPRFHSGYYRLRYSIGQDADSLEHFLSTGAKRGHMPSPFVETELGIHGIVAPTDLIEEMLVKYVRVKD